jgi:hypothetical protein
MELEKMFKVKLICRNHGIPVMVFRKLVSKGEWGYCRKTDSIPTRLMDDAVAMFKNEPKEEFTEPYDVVDAILGKLREKRDFYKVLSTLSGKLPDENDAALMLLEEMEWEIQNIANEEPV